MTEAVIGLVGVAIGGIIGVVATIVQQIYAGSRWRKETKLKYLRDERRTLAEQYHGVFVTWRNCVQENNFPDEIVGLAVLSLPSEIADAFFSAIAEAKENPDHWNEIASTFAHPMRKSLEAVGEEIRELLS